MDRLSGEARIAANERHRALATSSAATDGGVDMTRLDGARDPLLARRQRAGALAALAMLGAIAAGCGSTSSGDNAATSTTGAGRPADSSIRRFVQCMRSHGVPNFPAAEADGRLQLRPDSGIDPNSPEFRRAESACQSLAPNVPGREPIPTGPAGWPALAASLKREAAARTFSGAVLVAKDGRPVLKQADGFADLGRRERNTVATKFNVASVGKTFTAVAIARLVEQRKLAFDDAIAKYLPGFAAATSQRMTIAQLLTHTSGLGDIFAHWQPVKSPLDVSRAMTRIRNEPVQFAPGSQFAYSNSGYVVLGAIIEAVTGASYYDYVRQHVFKPANMTNTGWYNQGQTAGLAHAYLPVGRSGSVSLRDIGSSGPPGNPSGGAYSTVGDLTRFAQALLGHRLVSAAMTETILSGKVTPDGPADGSKYGYGFEVDELNGVRTVGHSGGAPGIDTQLRINPTSGYTVVILANLDRAAMRVYDQVAAILANR